MRIAHHRAWWGCFSWISTLTVALSVSTAADPLPEKAVPKNPPAAANPGPNPGQSPAPGADSRDPARALPGVEQPPSLTWEEQLAAIAAINANAEALPDEELSPDETARLDKLTGEKSAEKSRTGKKGTGSKQTSKTDKQKKAARKIGKFTLDPKQDKVFGQALLVQDRHAPNLMSRKGVRGTALVQGANGQPVIRVYLTGADNPVLPDQIEGIPVEKVTTGLIVSYVNPKSKFTRPVPIGISAAPIVSICYSGTLGCRVVNKSDRGNVYALSNNHVFANENNAAINSTIILQPSPGDSSCTSSTANRLGVLANFVRINYGTSSRNRVDCAIAKMDTGALGQATPSDGYGLPGTSVAAAVLGRDVMKYGRTSGFTTGYVSGLNSTISVSYDGGIAVFTGQIEFRSTSSSSLGRPGDSGSLIVNSSKNPTALLFAGGGAYTYGNPITEVLQALNLELPNSSGGKRASVRGKTTR